MITRWSEHRPSTIQIVRAFRLLTLVFAGCLLMFAASSRVQETLPEPPLPEAQAPPNLPDDLLPKITAAMQGVTTRDVTALSKALHIGERLEGAAAGTPPNTLAAIGDLDGDGVPELLLKWAIPDIRVGSDVAPAADSRPIWAIYLLSWDGTRWKASRLVAAVDDITPILINLGPSTGRGLVVLTRESVPAASYPAVFQVKNHTAVLLWDAQADDSRYEPLLHGKVAFHEQPNGPAEMVVTGRADPGLLQVEVNGTRGFQARAVYHWDGKAFAPAKTEYSVNEDYTLYRFISALHLHDYRAAYALVAPKEFLKADSPTLDGFRSFIQNNFPEFLQDEVFSAPEPHAGSRNDHGFELLKPDRRYVYHPVFSHDGKFLLTGLTRNREALPAEP
jgi:hypothetical protein